MKSNINKTVVVAMSGGVDSSVAAALLKEQGYDLIGITMKTWGFDDFPEKDSGCCSLETIYSAKNVAHNLGFPHYTLDFTEKFNDIVIKNFISEYLKGNTPNPCVLCNKAIKWGALLEKAESLGADYIATGHYAKLNFNERYKRFIVSAAIDSQKDQSYALWRVSQYALSKTLFPLSNYTKSEIRNIARGMGLKPADTPDSQEICFVPNDDYRELIQIRLPELNEKLSGGDIIYHDKKIGTHKGYPYYTIGQRHGLNIGGHPGSIFIIATDIESNTIYVGEGSDHPGLYRKGLMIKNSDVHWIRRDLTMKEGESREYLVRIRYRQPLQKATLYQRAEGLFIIFEKPQRSITPGQFAAWYEPAELEMLGSGVI